MSVQPGPIELELATTSSQPVIMNLVQLYLHDLSQFRHSRPDVTGRFERDDRYEVFFNDPNRCAYLFRDDAGPLGFGLVRGLNEGRRLMDGFFVVRSVRRQSVGRHAAIEMLRRHFGPWEIPFQEENVGAARFWRDVANAVAGSSWTEDRRPVPLKPHVPDDVWITLVSAPT